jgi:uncharacterized membrane protein
MDTVRAESPAPTTDHERPSADTPRRTGERQASIDLLRGVVMILMALDHVRLYFTNVPFQPEDMARTNLALFLTRWVTHYCAPAFFLLAGTSAYLSGMRGSSRSRSGSEVSGFLWRRGLWLVLLELTLVGFAWTFSPGWSWAGVIWALGWSMVIMAALVRLPIGWLMGIGAAMVLGHDLLDGVQPGAFGPLGWLWSILHVPGPFEVAGIGYFVLYPLVPWVGVMALGYALGATYEWPGERRRRLLVWTGVAMVVGFVLLRLTNLYGNPGGPFAPQGAPAMTLVALLNTDKYPPSLQFLLMTLGPTILLLGLLDGARPGRLVRRVEVFGRVPMFYYVLHIFAIHLLALVVALAAGQPWQQLGWNGRFPGSPPPGYGYGLAAVYGFWALAVALLYGPCRWFEGVKRRSARWWVRYL